VAAEKVLKMAISRRSDDPIARVALYAGAHADIQRTIRGHREFKGGHRNEDSGNTSFSATRS